MKLLIAMDADGFRHLVAKYSEDETTKARGGDMLFFDRKTPMQPKAVAEAAFALQEVNDVSPLVQSEKGFHILKLSAKRAAFTKSFEEVKPEIQRRLLQESRASRMKQWVEEMRKQQKVEVFEDHMKTVNINPPSAAPPAPAAAATVKPVEATAPGNKR